VLAIYERRPIRWLRDWGLKFAIDYIYAEDLQTNYVDIGPVNKVRPWRDTRTGEELRWWGRLRCCILRRTIVRLG
jgi:hypothetical protein